MQEQGCERDGRKGTEEGGADKSGQIPVLALMTCSSNIALKATRLS